MANVTPEEYERMILESLASFLPRYISEIDELRGAAEGSGDWSEYVLTVATRFELFPYVFEGEFYDLPPEVQNELATTCHTHNGDRFECVQDALLHCAENGLTDPSSLPDGLRDAEYLTVYRSAWEDADEVIYSSSWTLSLDVARWFSDRSRKPRTIYTAKIRPIDVLKYTNERKEEEIIQKGAVYDVCPL